MAHSLASPPATAIPPATATPPISTRTNNKTTHLQSSVVKVRACRQVSDDHNKLVHRRAVGLNLAAAVLSLNVSVQSANAAARRAPPPPVDENKEKKDPNVSGVLAKVLASKKRKEAMKENVAKLRDKGKLITE